MTEPFSVDELDVNRLLEQWRWNGWQCIGFKIPVVFRESANSPDNAYVADLYEQVAFLGDLHRQIAELPDGATVRLHVGRPTS